jgi:hypothetical protein
MVFDGIDFADKYKPKKPLAPVYLEPIGLAGAEAIDNINKEIKNNTGRFEFKSSRDRETLVLTCSPFQPSGIKGEYDNLAMSYRDSIAHLLCANNIESEFESTDGNGAIMAFKDPVAIRKMAELGFDFDGAEALRKQEARLRQSQKGLNTERGGRDS